MEVVSCQSAAEANFNARLIGLRLSSTGGHLPPSGPSPVASASGSLPFDLCGIASDARGTGCDVREIGRDGQARPPARLWNCLVNIELVIFLPVEWYVVTPHADVLTVTAVPCFFLKSMKISRAGSGNRDCFSAFRICDAERVYIYSCSSRMQVVFIRCVVQNSGNLLVLCRSRSR